MADEPALTEGHEDIYKQLVSYPWDKDREFQGGLSAILGPNPSASQVHDLTLRAQCFYLSRKKSITIDFDAYKAYLTSKQKFDFESLKCGSNSIANPNEAVCSGDGQPPPNPPPHSQLSNHASDSTEPRTAPYPPTFSEIVELITSGAPIPGIKEIPDTVLHGQGTMPKAPKRKKPWERELPDESEGTFGDERDICISQEYPDRDVEN